MKTIKFLLVMLFSITVAACSGSDSTPTSGGAGGTIPSAPTGVQAVASNNQQVTINWNPVAGATSYKLYMDTIAGISKNSVNGNANVMHHPNVISPFVHAGLVNGITYYFVVTAVNAAGESVESVQVSATPTVPTVPSAPTGVQAVAGNQQVTISWNPVAGQPPIICAWVQHRMPQLCTMRV